MVRMTWDNKRWILKKYKSIIIENKIYNLNNWSINKKIISIQN